MRLSATRLQTYHTCPRQYRYRYVEELPTTLTGPLAFGRVIHEVLCLLHQRSQTTGSVLDLAAGLEAFDWCWQEILERERPLFTESDPSPEEYAALAGEILAGYVLSQGTGPPPLAVEFPFEFPWGEHVLNGFIDRIDEGERGLIIVEFKTGKRKPSPKDLRTDLQLTFYAYAVEHVFEQPVERLVYYFLRDQTPLVTHRTPEDFRHLCEGVLEPTAAAIESGRFPPRCGWWCRWCDYQALCDALGPEGAIFPLEPAAVGIA